MPPTADLLTRRDHTPAAVVTVRRRRRRAVHPGRVFGQECPQAADALQRALDRRDNGGATGHC